MIKTQAVTYSDGETTLEGFFAHSSEENRPLILLCHAWRGLDEFIKEKAIELAKLGFASFVIDMYGKGVLGHSKEENAALKKPFLQDRAYLKQRLLKGFHTASALPFIDPTAISVLGFGFGGLCALDLARNGVPLERTISIYGHFDAPTDYPVHPIRSKVLILHGYNDPISPISELEAFQKELTAMNVDWQTTLYGNSYHAFATPSANDKPNGILYNPLSAERAWQEVKRFLSE